MVDAWSISELLRITKNVVLFLLVTGYVYVKAAGLKGRLLPLLRLLVRVLSCLYGVSVFFPRELIGGDAKPLTAKQRATGCVLMIVLLLSLDYKGPVEEALDVMRGKPAEAGDDVDP